MLPNCDAIWTSSMTTKLRIEFLCRIDSRMGLPRPPIRNWGEANNIIVPLNELVEELVRADRSAAIESMEVCFSSSRWMVQMSDMWRVWLHSLLVWSEASARRGEMNSVIPFIMYETTWYTIDFSPPVWRTSSIFVILEDLLASIKTLMTLDCHAWDTRENSNWHVRWIARSESLVICIRLHGFNALVVTVAILGFLIFAWVSK